MKGRRATAVSASTPTYYNSHHHPLLPSICDLTRRITMNQRQRRWNPNEATTGFFLIRFIGTWPSLRVEELPFNESEFQLIPWRISYPKGPKQRLMNGTANDGMAFLFWNFVLCINLTLNSCRFPLVGIHNNWLRVSLITCKVSCCIHLHQRDVKINLR